MKQIILLSTLLVLTTLGACEKDKLDRNDEIPPNLPRTEVPASLQGGWMYGQFSMTEYWSQNPNTYIGNAVQFAIAFKFFSNGTYEQYFTSSTVSGGIATYQQSVTKGTVEVNTVTQTIKTHPSGARYKRTRNGQILEERDLAKSELTAPTLYNYTTGTEASGTKAIYLLLQGTTDPLTFLQKL